MRQENEKNRSKPAVPAGLTLIEPVIVVAMLGALMLMSAPYLSDTLARKDRDAFVAEAVDALREAQSSVMSGRNNARYGVHFEAAKFVFFQGAVYNAADPGNVTHALTGRAMVASVTLSPGGACTVSTGAGNCDVHFASHKGAPTESGAVVFSDDAGATKTVAVGAAGMFDVN